jgi:hypothetical protein
MAKFCTKCGTLAEDNEAQFCQSCGAALPGAKAPQITSLPVNASRPAPHLPLAKIAKIAAVGVASLAVMGGGIWFLTKAPATPDAFALSTLLNADVKATEQRVCIGNFPYDKDPVFVNGNDTFTKNWLTQLVRAGIYNQPEAQTSGGWFPQTQYKYTRTPAGLKAIHNGKLCFADGIGIDKVEYSEPQKVNDKTHVEAKYTYHYVNPAVWIKQPEVKEIDAQHFGQSSFDESAILALEDGKWKLTLWQDKYNPGFSSFGQSESSSGSELASAKLHSSSSSGGFSAWIKNLFSSMGGNPLIGTWTLDSEKMGIADFNIGQQFEFTADEMRAGPSVKKVKYEVRGDKVLVTETSAHNATAFTIIDHDHIALETGMGKLNLRRVN